MSVDWPKFTEIVRRHQRFLLTSHIRPDADALGSELGMARLLRALGKEVVIVNGHATPPNLKFLDPAGEIRALGVDCTAETIPAYEVLIVLDTSAWAQLGPMADVVRTTRALKLVVDHHVSQDDLGAELFKDTTAEATGRLVTDAAQHLGVALTAEIAEPLFAAVATDTGWFRFSSTRGTTYRCAAQLAEAGARPDAIYKNLYEQDTLARLHLIGRVLAHAVPELGGRLVYSRVLREDFSATSALPTDTEDIINMMLSVSGTEVAVIGVEQASGATKFSFRSRAPSTGAQVDCSRVAETFGGGGHRAAAGATIAELWSSASLKVLDAVRKAMK